MTPTALAHNISSPLSAPWQTIPASAALQSIRNGNNTIKNVDEAQNDVVRKPLNSVRPIPNAYLNSHNSNNNQNFYIFKTLNYPNYLNESGDRTLQVLKRPVVAFSLRENELN